MAESDPKVQNKVGRTEDKRPKRSRKIQHALYACGRHSSPLEEAFAPEVRALSRASHSNHLNLDAGSQPSNYRR